MERIVELLEQQSQRMVQLQADNERLAISHQDQRIKLNNVTHLAKKFETTSRETISCKEVAKMIKTALEQ